MLEDTLMITKSGDDARARREAQDSAEIGDNVKEYLRAIGQHELLDKQEEVTLALAEERWMLLKETRPAFWTSTGGLRPIWRQRPRSTWSSVSAGNCWPPSLDA